MLREPAIGMLGVYPTARQLKLAQSSHGTVRIYNSGVQKWWLLSIQKEARKLVAVIAGASGGIHFCPIGVGSQYDLFGGLSGGLVGLPPFIIS